MKQLILICLLFSSLVPQLWAEGPPRPPQAKAELPPEPPKVSTGERIEIPDVGFSIVPPNGWMVNKNSHGSSLLFESPKQPNQTYQPTLQVMVFSKLRYIDEVTMKEYGDLIVEKFGKISNRVTGYRLRDAAFQKLETGDPAILFYTEFQYDDVPIMQMHILISSATNHFLMTYTDLAKVFDDESSPGLAIAYTSMHSSQLTSRPPWRWRGFAIAGIVILLLIMSWFTMRFMRAHRLAKLGQRIEDDDNKEITSDEESQHYSRHAPATAAESHAGDDEWASSKSQVKSTSAKKHTEKVSQVHSSHFDDDDDGPEVSDVVPISMLEKSLHPGRKRRQEQAQVQQPQAPVVPQPMMQHPMPPQGMPSGQQPMGQHQPQHPGMQQPQHPGMQQPQHPGMQQPQHPGMQQPQHPGMQQPQHPGMQQPQHPGMQQPQHPGMQQPQHPGMQQGYNQQPVSNHQPLHFPPQPVSNHQPISNHQPMVPQQPVYQEQTLVQQPMPTQGTGHPGMQQPMPQQSMQQPMGQSMPQQGMQQPIPQHSMQQPTAQPMPQQGMQQPVPQHGMQQPIGQSIPQQGMQRPMGQPMSQQGMQQPMGQQIPQHGNQQPTGQPMPGYEQQPVPHHQPSHQGQPFAQQPTYPQGAPSTQQTMPHQGMQPPQPSYAQQPVHQQTIPAAGIPQDQQPASQHSNGPQARHPQNPASMVQQPSMPSPQQTFAPQPPMISADGQPVFVPGQPLPAPGSHPSQGMPQPNVFAEAAQFGQNISREQPHSQPPVSEQPAYVHAQAPAPSIQAYAAQAPASAPAIQTLAPQASAPAMPAFEPAAEPMMEQPVTASRQMQNQALKKQPHTHDIDDEPEMTEEARLSEILPKAGTIEKSKPKRKGLFWRKKTDDDDDQSDDGDDKGSWKSATGKKGKGKEEEEDVENGDDWTVASNKKSPAEPVAGKDDDEPAESEAWAPEATKRSEPKRDSLLNETQGPQHLVRRTPQGPVTKERNASVTEDGWNLNDQVASDHDEEDEEEVG